MGQPTANPYRRIEASQLVESLTQLELRIRDRFPEAGLGDVCHDLIAITRDTSNRLALIEGRNWVWMTAVLALLTIAISGLVQLFRLVDLSKSNPENVFTLAQGIDAGLNIIFVVGGAVFFLVTMEDRLKRRRALRSLSELRSIIHVIDMHQLTKEPAVFLSGGAPTQHSPKRGLTPFELGRYLDYASEMLSLVAKVAVLYSQSQPDPVLVDAVSDIERLTSNLSQQIWQKIMLISESPGGFAVRPAPQSVSATERENV